MQKSLKQKTINLYTKIIWTRYERTNGTFKETYGETF